MAVADRCSVLRKGKYMGTVNIADTTKAELSRMMVGRDVEFAVTKGEAHPAEVVLDVKNLTVPSKVHKNNAVKDVSFQVHAGEIVCIAGIDGNGQSELVYAISGLEPASGGTITMCGVDITHAPSAAAAFWHEPHSGGSPQARSGAGLHVGRQHDLTAVF